MQISILTDTIKLTIESQNWLEGSGRVNEFFLRTETPRTRSLVHYEENAN